MEKKKGKGEKEGKGEKKKQKMEGKVCVGRDERKPE